MAFSAKKHRLTVDAGKLSPNTQAFAEKMGAAVKRLHRYIEQTDPDALPHVLISPGPDVSKTTLDIEYTEVESNGPQIWFLLLLDLKSGYWIRVDQKTSLFYPVFDLLGYLRKIVDPGITPQILAAAAEAYKMGQGTFSAFFSQLLGRAKGAIATAVLDQSTSSRSIVVSALPYVSGGASEGIEVAIEKGTDADQEKAKRLLRIASLFEKMSVTFSEGNKTDVVNQQNATAIGEMAAYLDAEGREFLTQNAVLYKQSRDLTSLGTVAKSDDIDSEENQLKIRKMCVPSDAFGVTKAPYSPEGVTLANIFDVLGETDKAGRIIEWAEDQKDVMSLSAAIISAGLRSVVPTKSMSRIETYMSSGHQGEAPEIVPMTGMMSATHIADEIPLDPNAAVPTAIKFMRWRDVARNYQRIIRRLSKLMG